MAFTPIPAADAVIEPSTQHVSLKWLQWFRAIRDLLSRIHVGTGSPAGVIVASPGDVYLNVSGGAGTTLYVKEANTDATGWRAV